MMNSYWRDVGYDDELANLRYIYLYCIVMAVYLQDGIPPSDVNVVLVCYIYIPKKTSAIEIKQLPAILRAPYCRTYR